MGVVMSIGGGDAPLLMTPEQFAAMARAMALHPSRNSDGAVCEVCGQRPDGDEFAIVTIDGHDTWCCDGCAAEFGDCGLCDTSHGGRSCPVDL